MIGDNTDTQIELLDKVLARLGFTVKRTFSSEIGPIKYGTRYTKPWEPEVRTFWDKFGQILHRRKSNRPEYNDDEYVEYNDKTFLAAIWYDFDEHPIYNVFNKSWVPMKEVKSYVDNKYNIKILYKSYLSRKEFFDKYKVLIRELQLNEMGI